MNMFKTQIKTAWPFYLVLVVIVALGWFVQQHILFNRDVSWLLEASKRLFLGGNYIDDFFENNPPWVLYFYLPAVLLHSYTSLHLFLALQFYVFILASFSLLLSWAFLQKIFAEDKILGQIFLVGLAIIFLLLPINEFGQREHLLLVCAFPYFLLIVARIESWAVNVKLAIAAGFLAGSVFMFKPYFLPTLLLLEGMLFLKQRRFSVLIRPETLVMFGVGLLYFILIVTRHQDYLFKVIPFAWRWCALGDHEPWILLLQRPLIFSSLFVFFYFVILYPYRYATLFKVLMLVLLGLLFSYFVQHTTWYYHRYPATAVAVLSYVLLFSVQIRLRSTFTKPTLVLLNIFYFILLTLYIYQIHLFEVAQSDIPMVIFSIFVVSFVWVNILFVPQYNKIKYVLTIFFIGMLFFIFSVFVRLGVNFLLSTIFLIIALGLLMPGAWLQKCSAMLYTGFGVILIAKVILLITAQGMFSAARYENYHLLIDFIDEKASNEKVYFFSTEIEQSFPVLHYSEASSASRFSHFWMLAGLIKQGQLTKNIPQDKDYLIELLSEDIRKEAPRLIFVDSSQEKNKFLFFVMNSFRPKKVYFDFDYLDYFSSNQEFRKVWKSYRYLTTLKEPPLFSEKSMLKKLYPSYNPYQFDVYEHI